MGSCGITMKKIDYGLDLLGAIIGQQLRKFGFTNFNVTEVIELLQRDILDDIKSEGAVLCSAGEVKDQEKRSRLVPEEWGLSADQQVVMCRH